MITVQCRCMYVRRCSLQNQIKLGDFDSADNVPGLSIKESIDQIIKFVSILSLGTPRYRAPEWGDTIATVVCKWYV